MNSSPYPFGKINYLLRQSDRARWQRMESRRYVLRSQLGFATDVEPSRPAVCLGCANFHGVKYGQDRATRSMLVCGYHPYGWQSEGKCPDWTAV